MKNQLQQIDESILIDIFHCAQVAMNDVKIVEQLSATTGLSIERIEALTQVAMHLSMKKLPECKTEEDITRLQNEMIALKEEFMEWK